MLKCPKTLERGLNDGLGRAQVCVIILAIYGARGKERAKETRENRNQTIKCRTKIKQSIPLVNTAIPYHTPKKNQNNQNTGSN